MAQHDLLIFFMEFSWHCKGNFIICWGKKVKRGDLCIINAYKYQEMEQKRWIPSLFNGAYVAICGADCSIFADRNTIAK